MRSVTGSFLFHLFLASSFFSPPLVRFAWTVWVDGLGLAVRDYCRDAGKLCAVIYTLSLYRANYTLGLWNTLRGSKHKMLSTRSVTRI